MRDERGDLLGCAGGIIGSLAGAVGGLIGGALYGPVVGLLRFWDSGQPGDLPLGDLLVSGLGFVLAASFVGAFAGLFVGTFTGLPAGLALGARLRLDDDGVPDLGRAGSSLGQGAGLLAAMLYWWWREAPELMLALEARERLPALLLSFALHLGAAAVAGSIGGRRAGKVFTSELEARLEREQP